MDNIAIVADDLTGASDTGIKLVQKGYKTNVVFNDKDLDKVVNIGNNISVNTGTRSITSENAFSRVTETVLNLKGRGFTKFYKKIDSTLRGNTAIEVLAIMDALNTNVSLIVPAIPDKFRYVIDSVLICEDVSGAEKVDIFSLFKNHKDCEVKSISIDEIRKGKEFVKKKIDYLEQNKEKEKLIIVCDSFEDADIKTIAKGVKLLKDDIILAGASAMAEYLPFIWDKKVYKKSHLLIAGTSNNATKHQIKKVISKYNCFLININSSNLISNNLEENYKIQQRINDLDNLDKVPEVIILLIDTLIFDGIKIVSENAVNINESIGINSKKIIDRNCIKSVIVTGGETASMVMKYSGAYGMNLIDEILSGLPIGKVIGGNLEGKPLITKSGGFGDQDSFIKVIEYLDEQIEKGWIEID